LWLLLVVGELAAVSFRLFHLSKPMARTAVVPGGPPQPSSGDAAAKPALVDTIKLKALAMERDLAWRHAASLRRMDAAGRYSLPGFHRSIIASLWQHYLPRSGIGISGPRAQRADVPQAL
jgi:hypothetical protein